MFDTRLSLYNNVGEVSYQFCAVDTTPVIKVKLNIVMGLNDFYTNHFFLLLSIFKYN